MLNCWLISGISAYSKIVTLGCKFLRKFMTFQVGIFSIFFVAYFVRKIYTDQRNFSQCKKVVSSEKQPFPSELHISFRCLWFFFPTLLVSQCFQPMMTITNTICKLGSEAGVRIHKCQYTKFKDWSVVLGYGWIIRHKWSKGIEPWTNGAVFLRQWMLLTQQFFATHDSRNVPKIMIFL